MADGPPGVVPVGRRRLFVRRLDEVAGRFRRRPVYEVATVLPGATALTDVERTVSPTSVLLHRGGHTTDVGDHVTAADRAWSRGTGPWRGFFPYETLESTDSDEQRPTTP